MDLDKKLQLAPGQALEIVAAPGRSVPDLTAIGTAGHDGPSPALLVFVDTRAALGAATDQIAASAQADRLTWVAYPKAGQLGTDLNRDSLAALLRAAGARPVRQVAIDDVWSALRFRPG